MGKYKRIFVVVLDSLGIGAVEIHRNMESGGGHPGTYCPGGSGA